MRITQRLFAALVIAVALFASIQLAGNPPGRIALAGMADAPWTPNWSYPLGFQDSQDYSNGGSGEFGVDVPLNPNTPIYAPESGTITYTSCSGCNECWPPGRLVETLDTGAVVAFGHVVIYSGVSSGQHVFAGQEIATVVSTCYGAHVEFMYSLTGNTATRSDFLPPPTVNSYGGCPLTTWTTGGGTSLDPCTVLRSYMLGTTPTGFDFGSAVSGDFNGDGIADFAVLYNYGASTTGIFVWLGKGDGTFQSPQRWWYGTSFDASAAKVVAGNFNGTAYSDLAVLYNYGPNTTGIWIWSGSPTGFTAPVREWYGTSFEWNASKLTAADVNGDGYDDLAVLYNYGGTTTGIWVWPGSASGLQSAKLEWYGTSFAWSASKLTAGDFNGDGYDDLAVLYNYGGTSSGIFVWPGSSTGLHSTSLWWQGSSFSWDASKLIAGDFNGATPLHSANRYNDFAVLYNYGSSTGLWVWQGQANSGFKSPQLWWQSSGFNWNNMKIATGNFRGTAPDGTAYDDFAALYNYGDSTSGLWLWPGQAGSGFGTPNEQWYGTSFAWAASQVV